MISSLFDGPKVIKMLLWDPKAEREFGGGGGVSGGTDLKV
jgi:hypothetical protein